MFFGEFDYKIDDKGRIPIPPKFRAALKDGVVLTPGAEKCITVYTVIEWKKVAATLTSSGTLTSSKLRKLNRVLFATAFSTQVDGQGRVAVPVPLREYAGIVGEVGDVVVAGANNYLEIWSKDQWEEEKAVSQEQSWQIIESLEKR